MSDYELALWIQQLINEDKLYKFYKSKYWAGNKTYEGLKNEVLREQHYECKECLKKSPKLITRADTVHHVQFVRKHPSLALSKYYEYKGKTYRNLIAVCKECHNKLHPEKRSSKTKDKIIFDDERW